MNDEMRLDPDQLRQHSARLAELGDRMGQSHAGLRDSLVRAEGCWGDDHLGMAFAKDFKPQADQLLAGLQAMEESLRSTASGIVDTVQDFEAQDLGAADRIQEATEVPDSRQLDNGTATYASGNTEPLSEADRASTPPAPTEPSSPGGQRTPDAPSRPRSPEGQQRSNPSAGQPGPSGGPNRADSSGSRPSSSSVSPPATTGNRPGPPGVPSTREANPSVDAGRQQTQPGGRPSSATGKPGAVEPARPNSRYDAPPRMPKPAEQPPTGGPRRRSEQRKAGNPGDAAVLGWLARMLTEKHGVEVIGFDAPGLDVSVVREFVAAVDRVLSDYPVVTLDVVRVADLDDDAGSVRWNPHDVDAVRWNPHDAGVLKWQPQDAGDTRDRGDAGAVGRNPEPRSAAAPRPTRSVTLGRRTAQQPRPDAAVAESQTEQLQVYAVTVAELGRALDFAGDGVARWKAQRTLIAEYLHREVRLGSTLAEVVHGYQRWRGQLTGDTGDRDFDVDAALGAAFAEVVVRGDEASVPAVALHELLVSTAAPAR